MMDRKYAMKGEKPGQVSSGNSLVSSIFYSWKLCKNAVLPKHTANELIENFYTGTGEPIWLEMEVRERYSIKSRRN